MTCVYTNTEQAPWTSMCDPKVCKLCTADKAAEAAATAAAAAEASAPGPRAMLCGRTRVLQGPGGPVGRTEWQAVTCPCTFSCMPFQC